MGKRKASLLVLGVLAVIIAVMMSFYLNRLDKRAHSFIASFAFREVNTRQEANGELTLISNALILQRIEGEEDDMLGFFILPALQSRSELYNNKLVQIIESSKSIGLTAPDIQSYKSEDLIVFQGYFSEKDNTTVIDPVARMASGVVVLVYSKHDTAKPIYGYAELFNGYGNKIIPLNADPQTFLQAMDDLSELIIH